MKRLSAFSSVVRLRSDLSREQCLDYWRGPRAQQAARMKGVWEYIQYHFNPDSQGLWPELNGVETSINTGNRIDGVEQFTLKNARSAQNHLSSSQSAAFKETDFYTSGPENIEFTTSPPSFRAGIFIRKKSNVTGEAFNHFIKAVFVPALANNSFLLEVRCRLLTRWNKKQLNKRRAAHENEVRGSYHALIILGTAGSSTLQQGIESAFVTVTANKQNQYCEAIHAYTVSDMYIFTKEGRPALPQIKPEPKLPLEPVRRQLPAPPPRAFCKKSTALFPAVRKIPISGYGPEDVVVDSRGRLLCGVEGGRILRIDPEQGTEEEIGNTGGRPLGLEVLPDGHVLVCDAHKGLLRLDPDSGEIETLVQYVNNIPLRFCSNAAAAADGTIWFTESTSRYDYEHYKGALYEHRPSGRLFKRDPGGKVEIVLDNLHFANGITINSDESAVLFFETDGYRLNRLWIRGPHAGKREILADNLPGFPDNASRVRNGKFWGAIVAPRNLLLDRLGTAPGVIRKLIWRIPDRWQPDGARTTWIMLFNEHGEVLLDLQDTLPDYHGVTGVAESNGHLYLASTGEKALLSVKLKNLFCHGT